MESGKIYQGRKTLFTNRCFLYSRGGSGKTRMAIEKRLPAHNLFVCLFPHVFLGVECVDLNTIWARDSGLAGRYNTGPTVWCTEGRTRYLRGVAWRERLQSWQYNASRSRGRFVLYCVVNVKFRWRCKGLLCCVVLYCFSWDASVGRCFVCLFIYSLFVYRRVGPPFEPQRGHWVSNGTPPP